jgi:hypothetical protein
MNSACQEVRFVPIGDIARRPEIKREIADCLIWLRRPLHGVIARAARANADFMP